MLCVNLKRPSLEIIERANRVADLIEFRLPLPDLKRLRSAAKIPVIFNFKKAPLDEELALGPEYVDLDISLYSHAKRVKSELILSYHNFDKVPSDFDFIFEKEADIYKVACRTHSNLEALLFLQKVKSYGKKSIAIALGKKSAFSRIIARSPIIYAPFDPEDRIDEGQFLMDELTLRYQIKTMTQKTAFYGLLGNPIDASPSARIHNFCFHELKLDARYLKIPLDPHELHDFLKIAPSFCFRGFSVTSPLKECFNPKKSINTLVYRRGKWSGYSTDGVGVCDLIEKRMPLQGKKMAILGAGGAARSIATEARKRGALISIYNRSLEKALQVASHVEGSCFPLSSYLGNYDITIQATSIPLEAHPLRGLAIELNYGETPFLKHARKRADDTIDGESVFLSQAIEQYMIWFNQPLDLAFQHEFVLPDLSHSL